MLSFARTTLALATAPTRLTLELVLALPVVVAELPGLVRDARVLVGELAWLSRDAQRGALADVVEGLGRVTREDGELTVLLREAARLAAAQADETSARTPAARASARTPAQRPRSGRASGGRPRSNRQPGRATGASRERP